MIWILTIIYFNNPSHIFMKAYTTKTKCVKAIESFEPKIAEYTCTKIKIDD